ncbi:lyase family protein, partial [Thermoflexus hugenholtzii]
MRLWGTAENPPLDPAFERLNASLPFDRRLYPQDIRGSIAWARALARAGILSPEEQQAIEEGLQRVREELDAGLFLFRPTDEDIHTAVERQRSVQPLEGRIQRRVLRGPPQAHPRSFLDRDL